MDLFTEVKNYTDLKISLDVVLKATKNFAEKNIIGTSAFGNVYKGKLIHLEKPTKIVARKLGLNKWPGPREFWTEVTVLSNLEHDNIVSLIGYCDEQGQMIIIYRRYPKIKSLVNFLSDPTALSWDARMDICQGVARAINYIHGGSRTGSVIHRNINSYTIVLDKNMCPRLSGFEHSIKYSERQEDFFREAIGVRGYIDPSIENGGGVTDKSDIYSLGIVLFEILCGRKANEDNKPLLGPLAKFHYENNTLDEIILRDLWEELKKSEAYNFLPELAYSCLHADPTERPTAYKVLQKFEKACGSTSWYIEDYTLLEQAKESLWRCDGDEEDLRIKLDEICADIPSCTSEVENLEKWRIELKDILFAIDRPEISPISSEYNNNNITQVMKTKLYCYDRERLILVEGVNEKARKKLYTVMIKAINTEAYHKEKHEEYLTTEIEVLSSCNHPNIESFLGFSEMDTVMKFLVSEFVSTDYLCSYLHQSLSWEKRLKICFDVARGLNYLHNEMEDQKIVIHRDVNSRNIVLDKNDWSAKIVEFGSSVFLPPNQKDDALHFGCDLFRKTNHYRDPEYVKTGKLKRESDVFSFGVVMLEILYGRIVDGIMDYEYPHRLRSWDEYHNSDPEDLANLVGLWFDEKIIRRKMDPKIKGENVGNKYSLNKGINEDSLDTFIKIMCQCLAPKQHQRPTMKVVVKELEKATSFQNVSEDTLKMSFEKIALATEKFKTVIGGGGFATVTEGKVGDSIIVAKKLNKSEGQGEQQFRNELQILYRYKHENIINLVGYCDETDAKIIVLEYASKGNLDKYLDDAKLTWRNRLKICVDIATALKFLHGVDGDKSVVIHRDIKCANILLFHDWKAKIGDFGLSLMYTLNEDSNYVIDGACGTQGYVDPVYLESCFLTIKSDIYSFGVVLFEILYGRPIYKMREREIPDLLGFVKHKCKEGKQDDLVFKDIKEGIVSTSLTTFLNLVIKCLDRDGEKRPTSKEVLNLLKKALELQVDKFKQWRIKSEDILLGKRESLSFEGHSNHDLWKTELICYDRERLRIKGVNEEEEEEEEEELTKKRYTVKIKRIDTEAYLETNRKEYSSTEIEVLSSCNHGNIESFIGFCEEDTWVYIVTEFVSTDYLYNYLDESILSWEKRLKICLDVARGLNYLHNEMEDQKIVIHRDVNSKNIVLDKNKWSAKIVKFGCSVFLPPNQKDDALRLNEIPKENYYTDPEYVETGKLKRESDVYSFGVVMLEVLCGMPAYYLWKKQSYDYKRYVMYVHDDDYRNAARLGRWFVDKKIIREKMDPSINGENVGNNFSLNKGINEGSLDTFIEVMYQCLAPKQNQRPMMKVVVEEIEKAISFQEGDKL
ncbi:uncharacterized protein [Rutidosis leptorrhynchoides]|uniref:uncharacterized protein n=1 Tax=Rutidosis leptorrhynchoides TaxID=125765 RepID=UPI003A98EC29